MWSNQAGWGNVLSAGLNPYIQMYEDHAKKIINKKKYESKVTLIKSSKIDLINWIKLSQLKWTQLKST